MMQGGVQQVNLYLPELRPRRELVTAVRLLQVTAAIVLVMVLTSLVNVLIRASLRSDVTELQAMVVAQVDRTDTIEREVAGRATDQALIREMETRELRLAQSRELYDFMSNTSLGNLTGYSAHLKDLSRASFPGLWLTEFSITGDATFVSLKGNAQLAAMLPDYVSRLAMGESVIRNKRFSRLLSTRSTTSVEEMYEFVLETSQ